MDLFVNRIAVVKGYLPTYRGVRARTPSLSGSSPKESVYCNECASIHSTPANYTAAFSCFVMSTVRGKTGKTGVRLFSS